VSNPAGIAVAEAVAYVAIRRVQHRYADIVNRRAWHELTGVMHEQCRITIDTVKDCWHVTGPADVGALIDRQVQRFDFFEFLALSTVMDIDAAAGRATTRLYMQEVRHHQAQGRHTNAFGIYHDVLLCEDGGNWRFAKRHYRSLARNPETVTNRDMEVLGGFELPLDEPDTWP